MLGQSFESYAAEQHLRERGHQNAGTEFYPEVGNRAKEAIVAAGGAVNDEDEDVVAVTFPLGTISYEDVVELPTGVVLREGEESLYRPA